MFVPQELKLEILQAQNVAHTADIGQREFLIYIKEMRMRKSVATPNLSLT